MMSFVPKRLVPLANHSLNCSRSLSSTKQLKGARNEPPFPVIEDQFKPSESAKSKADKAEKAFFKTLFTCQAGGGERGAKKHIEVNKKVLVRDRIRRILDDDADFFELGTTAGLGLDYGDVPGDP